MQFTAVLLCVLQLCGQAAANRVADVYQPSVPVSGGSAARPHVHTDYDADGNPIVSGAWSAC